MVILKKIRSATLIEALVATVLIVIVFMIASLVLNNLLLNSFKKNTHAAETRIAELEYQLCYGRISLPYNEEFRNWTISLQKEEQGPQEWITAIAINKSNNKEIIKAKLDAEN